MSTMRQGTLNRLRAKVDFPAVRALNLTNELLGPEGIRLSFENNATDLLPTMAGMVASPRPYQECTLTCSVVKSMPIGNIYKQQFERSTLVGTVYVYPDTASGQDAEGNWTNQLDPFRIENVALENIREMSFAGNEPTLVVTFRGYYQVNQSYFEGN
jgi:hypothetical protein